MTDDVAANLATLKNKISKICHAAGQNPQGVTLVAVSKQQPVERVRAALDAGHRLFGENRVQEAQARWEPLRALYPDVRLHLIGPLQTNKARDAVALFDVIETVDRPALVDALGKEMKKQNRFPPVLIEVNTGGETQKAGVGIEGVADLLSYAQVAGLNVRGFMAIPPMGEPPAPHFALLSKLAVRHGLQELSMGMSADFEKAIPLGATHIRLGTAVFGQRP